MRHADPVIHRRARTAAATLAAIAALIASGCAGASNQPGTDRPVPLFNDLGDHRHPVTTASEDAQHYFDQGLTLGFAFNHAEAERSFRHAASLDPGCAMCWWGVAFVLGPNLNAQMNPDDVLQQREVVLPERVLGVPLARHQGVLDEQLARRLRIHPPRS